MILNIKKITGAINKISDIVSGEKQIPGVMFNISDNSVAVCYCDNHRAFVEKIDAVIEEGDLKTKIVFDYEPLVRAIGNCQPNGNIKVESISFKVVGNVMRLSADQMFRAEVGDNVVERKMGTKTMDVPFSLVEGTSDRKVEMLNRMNYDSIFNVESGDPDVWDRKTLINTLNTLSFEKARNIYMSAKIQKAFVINSGFTCAIPVERALSKEDIDAIKSEVALSGDETQLDAKLKARKAVVHKSVVISSNIAKTVASVLNRVNAEDEKIYMMAGDGFISMFTGDDTVGIRVEQAKGSQMHIGSFERFSGFDYRQYQMTFLREFLADSIKSALNSSKNEKTSFTFRDSETTPGAKEIVITCHNTGASINDTYFVTMDNLIDETGTLNNAVITISLKSFADMLSQLKSDLVGIDISFNSGDQVCMRLSEVNVEKVNDEWTKARKELGLPADKNSDIPTPISKKAEYRANTLDTCQYALINLANKN